MGIIRVRRAGSEAHVHGHARYERNKLLLSWWKQSFGLTHEKGDGVLGEFMKVEVE